MVDICNPHTFDFQRRAPALRQVTRFHHVANPVISAGERSIHVERPLWGVRLPTLATHVARTGIFLRVRWCDTIPLIPRHLNCTPMPESTVAHPRPRPAPCRPREADRSACPRYLVVEQASLLGISPPPQLCHCFGHVDNFRTGAFGSRVEPPSARSRLPIYPEVDGPATNVAC